MFKYFLMSNPLAKEEKNFVALSRSNRTIKLEHMLDDMVEEGTGLTRPQALAYFEKLIQLVSRYLTQGYFVSTPLFNYRVGIAGVFDSLHDTFDQNRHKIRVTASAGARIRTLHWSQSPIKINLSVIMPEIYEFINCATDTCNLNATINNIAIIHGNRLNFDKADMTQGIFFVSVADPTKEYRVMHYSRIKPSEINFLIPEMEAGEYKVVIRTLRAENKEPISGILETHISC